MRPSLVVLSTVAAILGACGSSSDTPSTTPPAPTPPAAHTDPEKSDSGAVPVVDAGAKVDATAPPPVDNGSETYPAAHYPIPQMGNYGGPVIANMKVVTVTFVGDANRDALRAFDDSIVATPWWTSVTRGFAIHAGASGGYAEVADTVSGKTLDNEKDIQPWIQSLVTAGTLPAPTPDTLYAIYYPQSTTIKLGVDQSCQSFGAYHDSMTVKMGGDAGTSIEAAYAIMPNCGGGMTHSASHELIEAATDPHPQKTGTFYLWNDAWAGPAGGECADLCEGRGSVKEGTMTVSRSWVNQAAAESKDPCQPSNPALIFFGAAVETEKVMIVDTMDPTNNHESDGYLRVKAGQSRDVNVVVFSEAKLPSDLELVVGKRSQTSSDPHDVDPVFKGVDVSLDRKTGRNGVKVKLTIKVAAGTPAGDHTFVVRAILSVDDYHSWPVILRVE